VGWYAKNNGKRRPRTVASKQANAFGLYDMSGNAMEWVQDCWNYNYRGAPRNGSAWISRQCSRRVLRGGSWFGLAKAARAANRSSSPPDFRIGLIGFRLARNI
jgi:formylglycine-generating enzyme required for sulfatase activity